MIKGIGERLPAIPGMLPWPFGPPILAQVVGVEEACGGARNGMKENPASAGKRLILIQVLEYCPIFGSG